MEKLILTIVNISKDCSSAWLLMLEPTTNKSDTVEVGLTGRKSNNKYQVKNVSYRLVLQY